LRVATDQLAGSASLTVRDLKKKKALLSRVRVRVDNLNPH